MKRYQYLDAARGIAMMLVIIAHSCGLSKYLIYFFIQIFFILSGYLYRPGRSYAENIGRKARRLLLPYFGYNAILLLFYALTGRTAAETRFSALGILYSRACLYDTTTTAWEENILFFDVANSATWYLTSFFTASLVFYLVIDKCLESRKFLTGCLAVLTLVTMALAELPVLLPWSLDIAFVGALFMIVGTLLERAAFFEKKQKAGWFFGLLALYVVLVTVNPGLNTSIREYGVYQRWSVPFYILIGISGTLVCIWIAKLVQETIVGRFLVYVGQNTMILLGFHILGLELFGIIAGRFFDVAALPAAGYVLYHVVRIAASMCDSLVVGKVIDFGMKFLKGKRV